MDPPMMKTEPAIPIVMKKVNWRFLHILTAQPQQQVQGRISPDGI
jgi:hypothetical protein